MKMALTIQSENEMTMMIVTICSEFLCVLSCAITLCLLTHYITEINLSLSLSHHQLHRGCRGTTGT